MQVLNIKSYLEITTITSTTDEPTFIDLITIKEDCKFDKAVKVTFSSKVYLKFVLIEKCINTCPFQNQKF